MAAFWGSLGSPLNIGLEILLFDSVILAAQDGTGVTVGLGVAVGVQAPRRLFFRRKDAQVKYIIMLNVKQ